jgi:hypothetical protein
LFQDLFDDRSFGRASRGGTFDKAPPSATSAGSLPGTESYIDKNAWAYPGRASFAGIDPRIIELRERKETVAIRPEREAQRSVLELTAPVRTPHRGPSESRPEGLLPATNLL